MYTLETSREYQGSRIQFWRKDFKKNTMIIELYNTKMQEIKRLEREELKSYLIQHDLVCRKISRSSAYVVFESSLESIVNKIVNRIIDKIETDEVKVITWVKSTEQLSQEILRELEFYKIVVFRMTNLSMRSFFNFKGFLTVMEGVQETIPKEKVCLPPGCYGAYTLFAVSQG